MKTHPLEDLPGILEHFLESLRADLASSTATLPDTGARAVVVGGQANQQVAASAGAFVGWSLRETAGGTALVELRSGNGDNVKDASGALVATVELAAGESCRDWFGPGGVGFGAGLIVHVVTGAVTGAVYLRGVE